MARLRKTTYFDQTFSHDQAAILMRHSIEDLHTKRKSGSLPFCIQYKKYDNEWIYAMSFSTYVLISGLTKLKLGRIIELLVDAEENQFLTQLQKDYNEMDLKNYL